ncbi:hypothetical protein [Hymenobacter sp. BT491]|uniref:hypothetical protein n=1 Tax=Hymenobacter sp. BT491 TaxID=2766779 RepID=UPI001653E991|nr:hypothetical protein [Hymenobacter sp. BT491]MBC6988576.1 hypothetical protein [Hymenobacter sp. BT491]
MIGFRVQEEWLDYNATLGLEIRSPLFETDAVPGVTSYPTPFHDTPLNRRLLRFPALRARQVGPVAPVEADCYLGGSLWRRGLLRYKDYDSAKGEYQYQFEADADALATRIEGVTLPQVALPTVPVQMVPETADYVLFPVRNTAFYDKEKAKDYLNVVNYWSGTEFPLNTQELFYTFTPFPKVVPLLRYLFAAFGYAVQGSWVEDPEIQQLVLYSTRSLDAATGLGNVAEFALASLLPDVRVADLLIVLQQTFCLGYLFNPVRKVVEIRPLKEVIRDFTYQDRQARAGWRDVAPDTDGFTLGYTADSGDELLKNFTWPEVRLGNGMEVIRPQADTLRMVREVQSGREWLVPMAEQQGYSPRADLGMENNTLGQLRFLFYRGLQPDASGTLYPFGTSGTENCQGQPVGTYSLQWDGPNGLYETWHKDWLAFRTNARQEEREVPLTLAEFLALDPARKDRVEELHFLWERISVQLGGDVTVGTARFTYHQTAH